MMIAWLQSHIKSPARRGGACGAYSIHFRMRPSEHLMISLSDNGALIYNHGPNQGVGTGHAGAERSLAKGFFHVLNVRIDFSHISQAPLSASKSNWGGISPAP